MVRIAYNRSELGTISIIDLSGRSSGIARYWIVDVPITAPRIARPIYFPSRENFSLIDQFVFRVSDIHIVPLSKGKVNGNVPLAVQNNVLQNNKTGSPWRRDIGWGGKMRSIQNAMTSKIKSASITKITVLQSEKRLRTLISYLHRESL